MMIYEYNGNLQVFERRQRDEEIGVILQSGQHHHQPLLLPPDLDPELEVENDEDKAEDQDDVLFGERLG
ncbi:OLC1v1036928C1, partial [Oldenlandia corymbosa var. corymbosa]